MKHTAAATHCSVENYSVSAIKLQSVDGKMIFGCKRAQRNPNKRDFCCIHSLKIKYVSADD